MIREPNSFTIRTYKNVRTFASSDMNLTSHLFADYFVQEVALRDNAGRVVYGLTRTAEGTQKQRLKTLAKRILDASKVLAVNATNLAFVFLNRHYPLFQGKKTPLKLMSYRWDDFMLELEHDKDLLLLLNYDEAHRVLVRNVISEIKDCRHSLKLQKFLTDYARGYDVQFSDYVDERSRYFETVLLMLQQLTDRKLTYFYSNHAIEIVKAHVFNLKKFGNPIVLKPGHFIGQTAMSRLENYHAWVKRYDLTADKAYTFKTKHAIGSAGGFDF